MALVREVAPGDVVSAVGWDVAISSKVHTSSLPVGWLIPHGMNHKAAVEMGHKITLLYVGPVKLEIPVRDNPGYHKKTRKLHHFLTDEGSSICLEGHEFRHLSVCTS